MGKFLGMRDYYKLRHMEKKKTIPALPGYVPLSVAAKLMGLSRRMANQYVENGKVRAVKAGRVIMVLEEDIANFRPNATGRPRTRVPIWRLPVGNNLQFMTVIFTRIKPGQSEQFDEKLKEVHASQRHLLQGTVARYFSRSEQKPEDIQIVFLWRSTVMPAEKVRAAAVEDLKKEFADILDWESSWGEYGRVVMHT
jgi:hypothetical protein